MKQEPVTERHALADTIEEIAAPAAIERELRPATVGEAPAYATAGR